MNADQPKPEPFVAADVAAARLGVPISWLRTEAAAGRVPHLKVGRRRLFSASEVRSALVARAVESAPNPREAAARG